MDKIDNIFSFFGPSMLFIILIITMYYIYNIMNNPRIFFLDIDDTLLSANNIFIYFKENLSDNNFIKLTPHEYKKLAMRYPKYHFDFCDFDNPIIISESIIESTPILHNLEIVKEHIKNGWDLGILTARGEEDTIRKIIPLWLKKQLKIDFNLKEENIHAVGDRIKIYSGKNDSDKKLNVLIKYWKTSQYQRIKLIDDNESTINLIKSFEKFKFEYIHC